MLYGNKKWASLVATMSLLLALFSFSAVAEAANIVCVDSLATETATASDCDDTTAVSPTQDCTGETAVNCSLMDAIAKAVSGDTIVFNAGLTGSIQTTAKISMTVGGVTIDGTANGHNHDIVIDGPGATAGCFEIKTSNNTIKGLVIGNCKVGVYIVGTSSVAANGNKIFGNYIGVGPDGVTAMPNTTYGVDVTSYSSGNFIGTDGDGVNDAAEGNVISGNAITGVYVHGGPVGTIIAGNYIGLDATGRGELRNGAATGNNIYLDGVSSTIIGVDDTRANPGSMRNFIAGGVNNQIRMRNATSTRISGNYIGIDIDGNDKTSNTGSLQELIETFGTDNSNLLIGTDADGVSDVDERNVLAGSYSATASSGCAIKLAGGAVGTLTTVAGNFIGTNPSGTAAVGNRNGICFTANSTSAYPVIVGTNGDGVNDAVEANVISGNTAHGIYFGYSSNVTSNVTIAGNLIGVGAYGSDVGNGGAGIFFSSKYAQDITIGGDSAAEENVIRYNGSYGINTTAFVRSDPLGSTESKNVHFYRDQIYDNTGVPIYVATASDATAAPTDVTSTDAGGGNTKLSATAGAGFYVQFYKDDFINKDSNGIPLATQICEAVTYLGDGVEEPAGTFSITVPSSSVSGAKVTATATDTATLNNTSALATCYDVPAGAPTLTSISIGDTDGYTNDSTPAITIVSSGSPTHVAFSCNGGTNWSDWIAYSDSISSFDITSGATGCSTTNGAKTITAKLKGASDLESGTASDSTNFDNTGPSGSISNASGNPTSDDTPLLDLTISDSGVGTTDAQMRFSCDNSTWSDWEAFSSSKSNFDIKPGVAAYGCGTSDGSRTVYVQFKDSLGNTGSSLNTGAFTLDTAAPVITPTSPAADSIVSAASVDYDIDENAVSGTVTWTRSGGVEDAGSPHVAVLSGADLTAISRDAIELTFDAPLVSGTIYTITFSFTDAAGNNSTSTVNNVTYLSNSPPVTSDSTTTLEEDAAYSEFEANVEDPDGDELTYTIISAPSHGTIKDGETVLGAGDYPHVITGAVLYKPDANYSGSDSFTFKANDGVVDSNVSTINITITPVNDLPTSEDKTITAAEDTDYVFALSDFGFSDVDTGDALTSVMITQLESAGSLKLSGVDVELNQEIPVADISAGNLKFKAAENASGTGYANFKFKVKDAAAYSAVANTITVDVTAANDAPTLTALAGAPDMSEDVPLSFTYDDLIGAFSVSDPDDDAVSFKVGSVLSGTFEKSDGAGGWVEAGADTLISSGESARWTPAANANGTIDAFTLNVTDGSLDSDAVTVTFNVAAANDAPVASDQSVTTEEETGKAITLSATDVDSETLTYSIVAEPAHGVLSGTLPNVTYTPTANYNGSDSFTFKVNDGTADSNTATVSITVTSVDDDPVVATPLEAVGVSEDASATVVSLAGLFSDADNAEITKSILSNSNAALVTPAIVGDELTLTYAPNVSGNATIVVRGTAGDKTVDAEFTVTVTAVDDAPVLAAIGAKSGDENGALNFTIGATDIDSETIVYSAVGLPSGATLDPSTGAFVWTPSYEQSGTFDVTFTATADGQTDSEVVTITVNNVDRAPVLASIGAKGIAEGSALSFTISATDDDGDSIVYSATDLPSGATLNETTGEFSWTPTYDQAGSYTVRFIATANEVADYEDVTITVTATNRAPEALVRGFVTNEDVAKNFTLGGSDPDSEEIVLTFEVLTQPEHGTLSGTLPALTYTPDRDFNGTDSFTFRVSDGELYSQPATVTLTVTASDDDPVIATPLDDVNVSEDAPATEVSLADLFSDVDDVTIAKSIFSNSNPDLVSLSIDGDLLTINYSPDASGSATIVIRGTSSGRTVDSSFVVTVAPANDLPVASDQSVTTDEDTAKAITLSATDADSDTLTYSIVAEPSHGTLSGTPPNVTYTPTANYNGSDSFTFKANDGTSDGNTATVSITVSAANDLPVLAPIGDKSVEENSTLAFTISAADGDGDAIVYSASGLPEGAELNATTGEFSWTPSFDQAGSYEVTFTATAAEDSDSEVVTITVSGLNRLPVASDQSVTTDEDTAKAITLGATDEDGDALTYSIVAEPSHGTLSGTPPNVTYTPAANYNGSDSFTFKANDGTADSNTATVSITVSEVDDEPVVVTPISNVSVREDAAVTTISLADVFADSDNAVVAKSIVSNSNPTLVTAAIADDNLSLTYAPNESGTSTIVVRGTTGTTLQKSVDASFTVTVESDDDPPVLASIGEKSIAEGSALSFTISATDVDSAEIVYSASGMPSGATLDASTGAFSWTPTFAQSGTYNVTFTATAGEMSDSEEVAITVSNINQTPVLSAIGNKSVSEGSPLTFTLSANDADASDDLTFTSTALPEGATLNASSGAFAWTPTFEQAGSYEITFTVSDGELTDSETVTITVDNFNHAPVATAQSVTVAEDDEVAITLAGTDEDSGTTLSYTIVTQPSHGTLSGTAPNVTYTPAANYTGSDSFTFKVNDGTVDSAVAEVTITVTGVNDAPVASAASISTTEDTPANGTLSATDTESAALTYSIVSNGSKGTATITNASTGAFTYVPNANANGSDSFTFKANDGSSDSNTATVTVSISAANDSPVFDAISNNNFNFTGSAGEYTFSAVSENQTISFSVGAVDPDNANNPLTVTVIGSLPSGATFSGGNFSWKPSYSQAQAENYTVLFKATGSTSQSEFMVVNIPVVNVNRAPAFSGSISAQTINENQGLTVVASVADPDNDQLYYSSPVVSLTPQQQTQFNVNCSTAYLPQGAQLNGNTFTWTPSYQQSGQYCVAITVRDRSEEAGDALSATTIFKITVNNVTTTPLLESIGDRVVAEGQTLTFEVRAMDPETGDDSTLSYGMSSTAGSGYSALPVTAEFNQTTHVFTFTPSYAEAGIYDATFVVGKIGVQGTMAWESVFITVTDVNRAPTLASIGSKSVTAGANLAFTLVGSDEDAGSVLTYSATGLPSGASLNSSTGAFSWTPSSAQAGSYNVVFKVTDNATPPLSSAEQTVAITVTGGQGSGGEEEPETLNATACIKNLGDGDDCITDRLVASGSSITLDATISTGTGLSYEWTQVAGGGCPSVDFYPTEHEAQPTVTVPEAPDGYIMTCKFKVTVSDDSAADVSDVITVRVASNGYEDTEPNIAFRVYGQLSNGVVLEDPPLVSSASISKDVTEPTSTVFSVFNCSLANLVAWNDCERVMAFELPVIDSTIYDVTITEGNTGDSAAKEVVLSMPEYDNEAGAIYKFNATRARQFAQTQGVINPLNEQLTWVDRFVGDETYKNIGAGLKIADTDGDGVEDIVTKSKVSNNVYVMSIKGKSYANGSGTISAGDLNFVINAGSDVDISDVAIGVPKVSGDQQLMSIFVGGLGSMLVNTKTDVIDANGGSATMTDIFNQLIGSGRAKTIEQQYVYATQQTRGTTTADGESCAYYLAGRCYNPPSGYVPPSNYQQYGYNEAFASSARAAEFVKAESSAESTKLSATNIATADVNGDNYDDTIVGMPEDGKVYIFFGTADFTGAKETDEADVVMNCFADDDSCGSVIVAGDISSDGYADVIIGAPEADGEGDAFTDAGEIYVVYGTKDWPTSLEIATYPSVNVIYGLTENGLMGSEMVLTDIDGNGTDELIANLANNTALIFTFDLKTIMGRTLMLSRIALEDLNGTVEAPKVMLRMNLTASTDEALNVSSIKVTAAGTGIENVHVKSVSLYRDENRNGELDELDTKLGASQSFTSDNGTITFTDLGQTIAAGSSEQWIVVYEFVNGSSSLNMSMINGEAEVFMLGMFALLMSPVILISIAARAKVKPARSQRVFKALKKVACVVLAAGLMVAFASCGDNPDAYNSQTEGDYTFKASIASSSDIEISGAGGTVDVIGAPLEGDEVTVNFKSVNSGGETPTEPTANYGIAGSGVGCSLIRK